MRWQFDTSAVIHSADGAKDAACISSVNGQGGFCVGINYAGVTTRSPELWAQWSHQNQFDNFIGLLPDKQSNSGIDGVDDLDNWDTDETGFLTTWSATRWLPKYEFIIDYYDDEYRFSISDNDVIAWSYNTADTSTFNLSNQGYTCTDPADTATCTQTYITLTGAMSGLFTTTAVLAAMTFASFN